MTSTASLAAWVKAAPTSLLELPRLAALAAVGGIFATGVVAQDSHKLVQSTFTLTTSDKPGVVAEVIFRNSHSDTGGRQVGSFDLSLGGLTVSIFAEVGLSDPDTMTVEVPEGLIAVPRRLTIEDGTSGRVLIVPLNAVGM